MRNKQDKQGIAMMIAAAVVLLAIMGAVATLGNKPKAGTDNCIGEISRNTVIVIDHTEAMTDQTKDEIASRSMKYINEKVIVNERVSIFTISDLSKQSLKPLLSLCRPADDGSRLTENVQVIKRRFHDKFDAPIRKALMTQMTDSKESPIAQALTDISLSQYLSGKDNALLIYSDMLEHTNKFSLYKCHSPGTTIAAYRQSRNGAMERPEFRNTSVKLNLIPRSDLDKTSLKCRDQLWPWFFGNNNAEGTLEVSYLPGGSTMANVPQGAKK